MLLIGIGIGNSLRNKKLNLLGVTNAQLAMFRERLELSVDGLEGRCSIQLCYRNIRRALKLECQHDQHIIVILQNVYYVAAI